MRFIDTTDLYNKSSNWGQGQELWKNPQLKIDFVNAFFNKCWYSEAYLDGDDKPIDHFRPKSKVVKFEDYEYNEPLKNRGYDWLKCDYKNFRLCCTYSNRKTGEGGKSCYFPLLDSTYMTQEGNEVEKPALLDPLVKSDVGMMCFFKKDVLPSNLDEITKKRVSATKTIYNLTHNDFEMRRNKVWEEIERRLKQYDSNKMTLECCVEILAECVDKSALHSACAMSAVNSLAPDEIKIELDLIL